MTKTHGAATRPLLVQPADIEVTGWEIADATGRRVEYRGPGKGESAGAFVERVERDAHLLGSTSAYFLHEDLSFQCPTAALIVGPMPARL